MVKIMIKNIFNDSARNAIGMLNTSEKFIAGMGLDDPDINTNSLHVYSYKNQDNNTSPSLRKRNEDPFISIFMDHIFGIIRKNCLANNGTQIISTITGEVVADLVNGEFILADTKATKTRRYQKKHFILYKEILVGMNNWENQYDEQGRVTYSENPSDPSGEQYHKTSYKDLEDGNVLVTTKECSGLFSNMDKMVLVADEQTLTIHRNITHITKTPNGEKVMTRYNPPRTRKTYDKIIELLSNNPEKFISNGEIVIPSDIERQLLLNNQSFESETERVVITDGYMTHIGFDEKGIINFNTRHVQWKRGKHEKSDLVTIYCARTGEPQIGIKFKKYERPKQALLRR